MNEAFQNKIGLLSPCGWGNLGDAAIQEAMIHHIRKRLPEAEIYGFTLNPEDTEKRHNIAAFPLSAISTSEYKVFSATAKKHPGNAEEAESVLHGIKGKIKKMPLLFKPLKWFYRQVDRSMLALQLIGNEIVSIYHSINILRGFKLLIASGGGQLDDFWGGPWGHPYVLFKWAVLAKVTRTKFVFMSVGTSSLDSRLSRYFVRGALSLATYRSFRDKVSKDRLHEMPITRNDPVLPDLAYSLPVNRGAAESETADRPVVAVSPMSYCDPRYWPRKDQEIYDDYIRKLAGFVDCLTESNYEVIFFASNKSDVMAVNDVEKLLTTKTGLAKSDNTGAQEMTVTALLAHLVKADYVIASRLHGVILSHMLNLPVLAISPDPKVDIHMENSGQSNYCIDIGQFDVDILLQTLQQLKADRLNIKSVLSNKLSSYAVSLDKQYEQILLS